jgi:hypothetical protein
LMQILPIGDPDVQGTMIAFERALYAAVERRGSVNWSQIYSTKVRWSPVLQRRHSDRDERIEHLKHDAAVYGRHRTLSYKIERLLEGLCRELDASLVQVNKLTRDRRELLDLLPLGRRVNWSSSFAKSKNRWSDPASSRRKVRVCGMAQNLGPGHERSVASAPATAHAPQWMLDLSFPKCALCYPMYNVLQGQSGRYAISPMSVTRDDLCGAQRTVRLAGHEKPCHRRGHWQFASESRQFPRLVNRPYRKNVELASRPPKHADSLSHSHADWIVCPNASVD